MAFHDRLSGALGDFFGSPTAGLIGAIGQNVLTNRGIEDIDFIDSFGFYMGNSVCDGNALDFISQFGSLFGSQFFGIGKQGM